MTAREIIERALAASDAVFDDDRVYLADAVLAALTEAGYTVAKLEQVGWTSDTEVDPDDNWSIYDEPLGPHWFSVFRLSVSGASEQGAPNDEAS